MDICKFVDLLFYWLIVRKTNSQTLVLHSWTFEVLGAKTTRIHTHINHRESGRQN